MSPEYSYKDVEWCRSYFNRSDECLCEGNIIIPDSMDDIAKIITVKAYPTVTNAKTEDNRIVVTGQVKLNVLYIGENESNKICSLTTSHPFSHIISAPKVTEEFISLVNISSCALNYSVINSRRLKATSLLRFCAQSYKNERTKALCSLSGAETKTKERTFLSAQAICTKNIVITDNAPLPAGGAGISQILKQSAVISDKNFKVLNNKIIAKGNICVSILYLTDSSFADATITIPFTEVVEAEGISPNHITTVDLNIADCEIKPDTDLSGEYKMLDISLIITAQIKAFSTDTVTAVIDLYLPGGALKTTRENLCARASLSEIHEEEFVKENITLPKGMAPIQRLIDTQCDITGISFADDTITANMEYTIIYLSEDSSSPVNTFTAKLPLTHKCASKRPLTPHCGINHSGYALIGDNALELRISADFVYFSDNEESFDIFSDCESVEYTPEKRSSLVIAFVNKNDTLWDIAKKYNISLSHLASANSMEITDPLNPGEKLIIPR